MINSVNNTDFVRSAGALTSTANSNEGGFNAALQAEQARKASEEAVNKDLADIQEKGFRAWARDISLDVLKEKLRKKLEAQMGDDKIDPEKLAAIIQEMLEKEMEQSAASGLTAKNSAVNPSVGSGDQGNIFPQGLTVAANPQDSGGENDHSGTKFFIPSMM